MVTVVMKEMLNCCESDYQMRVIGIHDQQVGEVRKVVDSRDRVMYSRKALAGSRRQSTTLEVMRRHEKVAPEFGVEVRPMAPISRAGFRSVCQGPYDDYRELLLTTKL